MYTITIQLLHNVYTPTEYVEYFTNIYGNEFNIEQLLSIEHELKYIVFLLYYFENLYVNIVFDYIRLHWPIHYDAICYSCVHRQNQYISSYYG